jgi:hypothetical protein
MSYDGGTVIAKKSEILKNLKTNTDNTSNLLLQSSGDWLHCGVLYTAPTTQLSLVEFQVRL